MVYFIVNERSGNRTRIVNQIAAPTKQARELGGFSGESFHEIKVTIPFLGRTSLIRKLTSKSHPAIAVYNDFKYSTRSFFSSSVKFNFLKLL